MELRPLLPADEPAMVELLTNESIRQTYMLPDFETKEAAIPLFRRLLELSREGDHFVRGICAGGQLVGFLNDVWIRDGVIELGYVIHPAHQGRGYATAALKTAIAQLFRLGYREVMAGAFAENAASLRVMEKAGMQPVPETEEIEYRGRVHLCVYRSVSALALATPTLPELAFRKALLADPQTMSYNRAWGGTIDFSEDRWENWFRKWVAGNDPRYFYRYLYSRALDTFVGEAAYHYDVDTGRWLCDVIVQAQYRNRGFGTLGLRLLSEAAKENGIAELYDEILSDNPSIRLFLKNGFVEISRTETACLVKKVLK